MKKYLFHRSIRGEDINRRNPMNKLTIPRFGNEPSTPSSSFRLPLLLLPIPAALSLFLASCGCGNETTPPATRDTTPPQEVENLEAVPSDTEVSINLIWKDPEDADFNHVEITWTTEGGDPSLPRNVSKDTENFIVLTGLEEGMGYTFTVKTVDTSGNISEGGTVTATTPDLPHQEVRDLQAMPSLPETITLTWKNPEDADFNHVEITWTPMEGTPSSPQNITNDEMFVITALEEGMTYTFTVKTVDTSGNISEGQVVTSILRDSDGDLVFDIDDVDDDNDGLIDIHTLEDLNNIRYNGLGTSYKTKTTDPGNTRGAPASGLKGYELARGLDFEDDASYANAAANRNKWTTGGGWLPIDNDDPREQFRSIFEGNGYVISNLYINRATTDFIGLFSSSGSFFGGAQIRNLGLEEVDVSGKGGVGGLVGDNDKIESSFLVIITNCYVTGTVMGSGGTVGGLVGANDESTITSCYSTATVTGSGDHVGGLVGVNNGGVITSCYSTGVVTGSGDHIGGLVGNNTMVSASSITACYATGNVIGRGTTSEAVGGLAGYSAGNIISSYATGVVTASGDHVGGLVGRYFSGQIIGCYARGNVTGNDNVGGLVGLLDNFTALITACYARGNVTGNDHVGGLVGLNKDTIIACFASGSVSGTITSGLLVGDTDAVVSSSYWDTDTTMQTEALTGATGLSTVRMKASMNIMGMTNTYPDFGDFRNAWFLMDGFYPRLKIWSGAGVDMTIGTADDTYSATLLAGQ